MKPRAQAATSAPAPSRAALYLRVSTGRQAEQDLSIPDQRRQAQAYCTAKGWTVAAEYVEPGASAMDDRRPEFQRMVDAALRKPPEFDRVVVHSFSRFFRDHFELEFYVRKLAKNGVKLVSITQDLGDDPMSVMMRQIMTLFDEYQSRENAKHTLRAMKENARQGYWNGSRAPFGYRIVSAEQRGAKVKKKLEVDPLQGETVRLIFRLALQGDGDSGSLGVKSIADHLNRKGLRTATGGRWGLAGVHDILTRRTYIGEHHFNSRTWKTKERKPEAEHAIMSVPPIMDEDRFNAVQEHLRSRAPQNTPPRVVNGPCLLTGICFCARCGGAMTLRTGKGGQYRYYTCSTRARQGDTGCKGRTIRMDRLDELVATHLEQRILDSRRVTALLEGLLDRRLAQADKQKGRIGDLRRQAAEADCRLTRLYDAIENGLADLNDANLKGRMAELKQIRDAARADADRAETRLADADATVTPEKVRALAAAARRKLRKTDGGYCRHHLRLLAQRIEVDEDEVRIMGTKTALLAALASEGVGTAANGVFSFVPKWRARNDSNVRPSDS